MSEQDTLGNVTTYEYNSKGMMIKKTGADGTLTSYEYDKVGRRIKQVDDRFTTDYEYDKNGILLRQKTTGDTEIELIYSYNKNNQLVSEERISSEETVKSEYTYDAVNQLIKFTRTDGYEEKYTYDEVGNMTSKHIVDKAGVSTDITMSYNKLNQLIEMSGKNGTIKYTYDLNGNLVEKQLGNKKDVYTYDSENHLVKIICYDGYIKEYAYDSSGHLIEMKEKGNATRMVLEELVSKKEEKSSEIESEEWRVTTYVNDVTAGHYNVLAETTNGVSTNYVYGIDRISANTNESQKRNRMNYVHDCKGSVIQVVSDTGINNQEYTPFGEWLTERETSGYGYNGEAYDAPTKTINLRARRYEPLLARFSQKDLMKGDIYEPITLNAYVYVKNDPVNYTDPSGMISSTLGMRKPRYERAESDAFWANPKWVISPERLAEYEYARYYYDVQDGKAVASWAVTSPNSTIPGNPVKFAAQFWYKESAAAAAARANAKGQEAAKKAKEEYKSEEARKAIEAAQKEMDALAKAGKLTAQKVAEILAKACAEADKKEAEAEGKTESAKAALVLNPALGKRTGRGIELTATPFHIDQLIKLGATILFGLGVGGGVVAILVVVVAGITYYVNLDEDVRRRIEKKIASDYQYISEKMDKEWRGYGTEDRLEDIAGKYGYGKCEEAAKAIEEYLKKQKANGTVIILTWTPRSGYVWSDRANKEVGNNGMHMGVSYNGIVYCNIHPTGLPEAQWIADFNAHGVKNPPTKVPF